MSALLVLGACSATDENGGASAGSTSAIELQSPSQAPTVQTVSGKFAILTDDWLKVIPNTEHDDCGNRDGQGDDSCTGSECYGVGPADGLDYGTPALVTNALGTKVGLGEMTGSLSLSGEACSFTWSVDVPKTETGVLTVTFDNNPNWSADFTLTQMTKAPHRLDFITIGS